MAGSEDGDGARVVVWRRMDTHSLEYFRLMDGPDGPRLEGTVVYAGEGGPLEARYTVECDRAWRTRSARVEMVRGAERRALSIAVEGGRWMVDGAHRAELDGCVDVDVSLSPSTNTLPIRRLGLVVGGAAEVAAAWVRFPGLTVETLPQRYTRLDERRWRYESRRGAFIAELEVDEDGVVTRYGSLWERVAG